MTTIMKLEVITYFILRVINYITSFAGALLFIGVAGSLEMDSITFEQFWLYELVAFCLIGCSFLIYYIRNSIIKKDFIRRKRQLRYNV